MPEREVVPRYRQIAEHYRDQILDGTLRPGDELPSERRIADEWDVARPTAARALLTLRLDGLTESRKGAGTFVADVRPRRRIDEHHRLPRSAELMPAADEHMEILAADLVPPPADVAAQLRLDADTAVLRRRRVVFVGDDVAELSTSWFPTPIADAAPRLLRPVRGREGTLTYLERAYGCRAEYARDFARARLATGDERAGLRRDDHPLPVLVVRHVLYDEQDRPLELAETLHPPGHWALEREYPLR